MGWLKQASYNGFISNYTIYILFLEHFSVDFRIHITPFSQLKVINSMTNLVILIYNILMLEFKIPISQSVHSDIKKW